VDEDTVAFDLFWEKRTEEAQRRATEVPIEIATACVAVADVALELYDHGARSSQGEAIAALSAAIAGGETAAHVAHLNLNFAADGDWTESRRQVVRELRHQLRGLRQFAEDRIYGYE
jgi:formiminotetrahydrofolate cyclodeaminase